MEYTDIELKNEQWRDIDGYDGAYQVSDLGRVRSHKSGEWKVMIPKKVCGGYLQIDLCKSGNIKHFLVHRLVASAFIPNDDETKTQINHINECKSENKVSNLEWCSAKYNKNYSSKWRKVKELYDPNLSYDENIEIFMDNGVNCSKETVRRHRKDLGLTKQWEQKRDKIKELYDQNLTYAENIELFRSNGVECSRQTILNLRRDLGITKQYRQRKTI